MRRVRALLALVACACAAPALRPFPDRPVAWEEHDDAAIAGTPKKTSFEKHRTAHQYQEVLYRDLDRRLSMMTPEAAEDVNALDEVPCSTWYCPRNHLGAPVALEEAARGPGKVPPPRPPLTILNGKGAGAAVGFVVEDAEGRKYILKFDPLGHRHLQTGAEIVGARLFHLLGYYVPDSFLVKLRSQDLRIKKGAKYVWNKTRERDLDDLVLGRTLASIAHEPDGQIRAIAIAFLPGKLLGGFDFQGHRKGDANDRIAHERRRSIRASRVFGAWINYFDLGPANTLDALEKGDRGAHVRHHFIDFGSTLGAATVRVKYPDDGYERDLPFGRMVVALVGVGLVQREWQKHRAAYEEALVRRPEIGWFPVDGWRPGQFRTNYPYKAHAEMTDRDAYWAAKVATSVTNAQIAAIVAAAEYGPQAAAYLRHALIARRDAIGRAYLTTMTAVESPRVVGRLFCFDDLAIRRGFAAARDVRYHLRILDDHGRRRAQSLSAQAVGPTGCLPILASPSELPYRVIEIRSQISGRFAQPARIHLAWRPTAQHFVVVGIERGDRLATN